MEAISATLISKSFNSTLALDNVSIHVRQGEIYGFLGLNGAGKTTLIKILLGMIKPTTGYVHLFGRQVRPNFDRWNDVGYLMETPNAYPNLSVAANLQVYYRLRQLENPLLITEIIERLKLNRFADKKAKDLSLGNKQRLGLAKALMHKPKLIILDEPINGLDPEGIVEVRKLLAELSHNGSTIFLSSHILGEISKIATRIGIVDHGKLITELAAKELTKQLIKKLLVKTNDNKSAIKCLAAENYQGRLTESDEIEILDEKAIQHPENLSKLLVEKGLPPKQVYEFSEDLETFFLRTIKR